MPQEFHILQCFNCETYQVDIVKKLPKWNCKMCGEKQSLKKIYGKGSGRECRLLVQKLNEQRLTQPTVCAPLTVDVIDDDSVIKGRIQKTSMTKASKWNEFIDWDIKSESEESTLNAAEYDERKNRNKWEQFVQNDGSVAVNHVDTSSSQVYSESKVLPKCEIVENIFEDDDSGDLDAVLTL